MQRPAATLATVALVCACGGPSGADEPAVFDVWNELGGSATDGGITGWLSRARCFDIAFDSAERPFVLWCDGEIEGTDWQETSFHVTRWDGSSWELLGDVVTSCDPDLNTNWFLLPGALAVDESDQPIVAWTGWNESASGEVWVRRWNGTAWEGLGESDTPGGVRPSPRWARDLAMRALAQGRLSLAWSESGDEPYQRDGEVTIRSAAWDGTEWTEPIPTTTLPADSRTSVALDSEGHPWVAWSRREGGCFVIRLRLWSGAEWIDAPSAFPPPPWPASGDVFPHAQRVCLTLGPGPEPSAFIAWADSTLARGFDQGLGVIRWSGGEFTEVGQHGVGEPPPDANAHEPWRSVVEFSLGVSLRGDPLVAWSQGGDWLPRGRLDARRWDGGSWAELARSDAEDTGSNGTDFGIERGPGYPGTAPSHRGLYSAEDPVLRVSPQGRAALAWTHHESEGLGSAAVRRPAIHFRITDPL